MGPWHRGFLQNSLVSAQAPSALLSCTQDPAEEETTLVPLLPPSHAPGSGVQGSWELLSQTKETGMGNCVSFRVLLAWGPRQIP